MNEENPMITPTIQPPPIEAPTREVEAPPAPAQPEIPYTSIINSDISHQLRDPMLSESQQLRLLGQDNFHEIDLGGPLDPLDWKDSRAVGVYNKAFAKHQNLIKGQENDISYGQILNEAGASNDISSAILAGVFHTESRYNQNAGTYKQFDRSAQGPFQFTQQTADHVGLKNRNSVTESANAASKYIKELLDRFDGNIVDALRAYNAGPGAIEHMKNRFGVDYLILTDSNGEAVVDKNGEYIPITENFEYPNKVLKEAYKYGIPLNTKESTFLRSAFKFGE